MIKKINYKKLLDVLDFTLNNEDKFEDFYVTSERKRIFIKDLKIIDKILRYQEVYGFYDKSLIGIILIYREKTFRPYIKILAKDEKTSIELIRFLVTTAGHLDLFFKLKKINPISRIAQRYGFEFMGNRGQELLLVRKKSINRLVKIKQDKDLEE
jgi:hypothetical protein